MNNTIDYSKHSQVIEYPYTISRSIVGVNSARSFELKGLFQGVLGIYCQLLIIFSLCVTLLVMLKQKDTYFTDKAFVIEYIFTDESDITSEYERYKNANSSIEKDSVFYSPLESYEEFREGWLEKHGGFWNKLGMFFKYNIAEIFLLIHILIYLFTPTPVVVAN
ncbi:hypothetical protein [Kangiella sp.]|uniref:hypothetical protein n=1 Tax=Kangiella sp. TaxID=1920245 RepID=UPI0019A366AA|nr:hypothetical protein [Kangiella sp.]MBD3652583.1 hypothetical protein [Kangiella sp.]MBD3652587.1 hypothetical protein [Kangiella sp.]